MGRYYNGDVDGKFMFSVQPSDAHERFGAVELDQGYIPYIVYRTSYAEICSELDSIKKKGHVDRVENMFDKETGWNSEIKARYNVTDEDLSEYADYQIGIQLKEFFDDNPDLDECRFDAEI